MIRLPLLALPLVMLTAGCDLIDPGGPIEVSVIGDPPRLADPSTSPPSASSAVLLDAVAQGLVTYNAEGQIEPALAQRWVIADGGLSYIFRLSDARWGGRNDVEARDLVGPIRAAMGRRSNNRMRPLLDGIEEVNAITPDILELRLRGPRPNLLGILAQPDMAMLRRRSGSGPMRIDTSERGKGIILVPADEPVPAEGEEPDPDRMRITLRGERAALAVARFVEREADLVLGGRYHDVLIARAAGVEPRLLRFDPAEGLFGLQVIRPDGFLADADNRRAVSMAIDRVAMVAAIGVPSWRPVHTLLPGELNAGRVPVEPGWTGMTLDNRVAVARGRVDRWIAEGNPRPQLSISLPDGPGSTVLFARLAIDLARIGVIAERAPARGPADLRLLDRLAPNDSAAWYLESLGCDAGAPCSDEAVEALAAAREARTIGARRLAMNTAEEVLMTDMPFIPLAQPMRWSLVRPRLTGFVENRRAAHPLHRLVAPPR